MTAELLLTSPNGAHDARLEYEGEIRFGPAWYRLRLDGELVPERVFGQRLLWSDDSRYLAAEEWLTTEEAKGPLTRAVLFDVERDRWVGMRAIPRGFAEGFAFEGATFVYCRDLRGVRQREEVEVDIASIESWEPCAR